MRIDAIRKGSSVAMGQSHYGLSYLAVDLVELFVKKGLDKAESYRPRTSLPGLYTAVWHDRTCCVES
jgi:hypothetical protein